MKSLLVLVLGLLFAVSLVKGQSIEIGLPQMTSNTEASLKGRVITPDGLGLRNAIVYLTDGNTGKTISTPTSSLGYYNFESVKSQRMYLIQVGSRRYRFKPIVTYFAKYTEYEFDFYGEE